MWAMTHASQLTTLDGSSVCTIGGCGGAQQQQQQDEEEDTDGKADKPDKPRQLLYDKVGFVSGLAAGAVDTVVNYIPYGMHYRRQRGEILHPLKNPRIYWPRELYRGVVAYSTIIPVTCIADGFSLYLMRRHQFSPFVATFISGMCAALIISAPTSNVIINQQQYEWKMVQAIRTIVQHWGYYRLTTGMSPLLVREGIYSSAVFYARPRLQQYAAFADPFVASLAVGIIATILSQPCDTLATFMIKRPERVGPLRAAREMWHDDEGGIRRFYRGCWLRGSVVVSGILVMGTVADYVKAHMHE
jgi:hypothetical protein